MVSNETFVCFTGNFVLEAADIAFILDSSGSIGQDNWHKVLEFVTSVVDDLDIDGGTHRIGIASFGSYAFCEIYLDQFSTKVGLRLFHSLVKKKPAEHGTLKDLSIELSYLVQLTSSIRRRVKSELK